jgi:hypothetical protein
MRSLCLTVAAAAMLAALANAAGPTRTDDKPVCRSEKSTGSRISTSECHSRAEWVEIDASRAEQAEAFQRGQNNPAADRGLSTSPFPR